MPHCLILNKRFRHPSGLLILMLLCYLLPKGRRHRRSVYCLFSCSALFFLYKYDQFISKFSLAQILCHCITTVRHRCHTCIFYTIVYHNIMLLLYIIFLIYICIVYKILYYCFEMHRNNFSYCDGVKETTNLPTSETTESLYLANIEKKRESQSLQYPEPD